MRYFRVLVLVLLASLWVVPAWGEITPEARRLMDEHRCLDGSTLTEVFQAAGLLGMKLVNAQIIPLDDGQKALLIEYKLDYDELELMDNTLLWSMDSQGRQLLAPLSAPYLVSPRYGCLTTEIAELGKAAWLLNINEFYELQNEQDRLHDTKAIAPECPYLTLDPSILAVIPAAGYAGGVAELARKAGLHLGDSKISTIPSWRDEGESLPGVYIAVELWGTPPANWDFRKPGDPPIHIHRISWRLAPGSRYFQPLTDNAALLSAGILPKLEP